MKSDATPRGIGRGPSLIARPPVDQHGNKKAPVKGPKFALMHPFPLRVISLSHQCRGCQTPSTSLGHRHNQCPAKKPMVIARIKMVSQTKSGQWIRTSALLALPTGRRTRYPKAKPMSNVTMIHAATGNRDRWFP
jgi:hypothetical protein